MSMVSHKRKTEHGFARKRGWQDGKLRKLIGKLSQCKLGVCLNASWPCGICILSGVPLLSISGHSPDDSLLVSRWVIWAVGWTFITFGMLAATVRLGEFFEWPTILSVVTDVLLLIQLGFWECVFGGTAISHKSDIVGRIILGVFAIVLLVVLVLQVWAVIKRSISLVRTGKYEWSWHQYLL